jgi:hypothetical protein
MIDFDTQTSATMLKLRRKWCEPHLTLCRLDAAIDVVGTAAVFSLTFLTQEILPNIVTSLASADFRVTTPSHPARLASSSNALRSRFEAKA